MTVPRGIPTNPRPCQLPIPKLSIMLAAMFTMFTVRSVSIELTLSCIPMNQPLRAIRLRVAGAAQMRMMTYWMASWATPGVASRKMRARREMGHCSTISNAANPSDSFSALTRIPEHSSSSPRGDLPSEGLSTPGQGLGEGPIACDGRGRSERSERSPEEGSPRRADRPYAWAVRPPVLARRKAKFQ